MDAWLLSPQSDIYLGFGEAVAFFSKK
jgi:hypothetical protein